MASSFDLVVYNVLIYEICYLGVQIKIEGVGRVGGRTCYSFVPKYDRTESQSDFNLQVSLV